MYKAKRAHITKRVVDALKPLPSGEYVVWDADNGNRKGVSGFGVRVRSTGAKTYFLHYRNAAGKVKRLTLGRHGDLTPDMARKRARKKKGEVLEGIDPAAQKTKRRRETVTTVEDLAGEYLERYAKPHKRTWKADETRIARHILPHLGTLPLAEVKRSDVRSLYEHLGRENGHREAEHVRVLLSGMFRLASEWEQFEGANPAKIPTHDRFRAKRRKRTLQTEELTSLLQTLDAVESDGEVTVERDGEPRILTVDRRAVSIVRLLLLTGLRSSEIRERRWEDFDRKGRTLRLGQTKAGTPRTVPLSDAAVDVLREVNRVIGSPWVFPSPTDPSKKPISRDFTIKQWRRIALAAGLARWVRRKGKKGRLRWYIETDVNLHDIRHHVATDLANRKVPAQTLQKILGHQAISTTMGYVHAADVEAREAMEAYTQDVVRGAHR